MQSIQGAELVSGLKSKIIDLKTQQSELSARYQPAHPKMATLQEQGRRVPDDVGIVGFDDSSWALRCKPQLSTVKQPADLLGRAAAELVLAQIEGNERALAVPGTAEQLLAGTLEHPLPPRTNMPGERRVETKVFRRV